MKKQGWLTEFEALRGLSIVLLLMVHAGFFSLKLFGWLEIGGLSSFVVAFLLGSFFFLAGYFFDMSIHKYLNNIWYFVFSRIIRIFPPYWVALWLFTLMYDLRKRDLLVYALNLQVIFSPEYVKPLLTLWYISLLVVYYILFGFLVWKANSNRSLFAGALLIFLTAYILHVYTGLFDQRFFRYYFVFFAGIYLYRNEDIRNYVFQISFFYKLLIAAVGVILFSFAHAAGLAIRNLLFIAAALVFILSWVLMWLSIFRTNIGNWKLWVVLSTGSYFAYLFHRPVWHWVETSMSIPLVWDQVIVFRLVPISVLLLLASYYLQLGYDRLLFTLRLK